MMSPQTMHEGFTRDHPSSDPPKRSQRNEENKKNLGEKSQEKGVAWKEFEIGLVGALQKNVTLKFFISFLRFENNLLFRQNI